MPTSAQAPAVPRLTYLRIKNYRALRDVEFRNLTPLTVLIGPNGSGKSTVLDALDFLAEAVRGNLVAAWEKRDRFRGMRTRGRDEAIEFEIKIESNNRPHPLLYKLVVDEASDMVFVSDESLVEVDTEKKRILYLDHAESNPLQGQGFEDVFRINGYSHDVSNGYSTSPSSTPLVARMGFFKEIGDRWPSVLAVVEALTSYRLFHLTDDHLKGYSDAGPREKLSPNGDNLPNVLYYLHLRHPEVLARLADKLRAWVPGLADVIPEITSDERLLLRFKDAPFEKPLPAQYMSGGTMRLAALLTLLYEPNAAGLLGIEEPENELHPQLLGRLAEELIKATETRQLLVATHSPAILNALEPAQVWILHRGTDGYTQATRVADLPGIPEMVEEGSPLGYLWTRNFFDVGDPLAAPNATEGC
jgi:predicted ATPase